MRRLLSNYCNLQLKSLLHLGQNVITFRTLLHLGLFITFRPCTHVNVCEMSHLLAWSLLECSIDRIPEWEQME